MEGDYFVPFVMMTVAWVLLGISFGLKLLSLAL